MKNVHTEHCCKKHGCKYGYYDEDCPVTNGSLPQSFPCESCDEESGDEHAELLKLRKTVEDIKVLLYGEKYRHTKMDLAHQLKGRLDLNDRHIKRLEHELRQLRGATDE